MKKFFPILAAALTLFAAGCASESFTAETYEGEAQAIVLDLENTAVEVLPAEGELVRIEYYVSDKRGVAFSLDGGTLTVTSTAEGASVGALPDVEFRTVKVYVPAGLEALSLTTTGENVSLADISAGEIALDVNGGSIAVEELNVGTSLSLTAKNGNISGSVLGGWDDFAITCTVKKGKSSLPEEKAGGEKTLTVDCSNGDVSLELIP